ncbi:MAG: hypothetical protein OEZ06_12130 [Myxococcales bacterium]|nr:hypothetical protein [Myxococcales bacterium]
MHAIADDKTWQAVSFPAAAVDQARATTYLIAARDDSRLAPLFVDASAFEMPEASLHHRFLTESFPEFAELSYEEYLELTLDPDRREFFAGSATEFISAGEPSRFGFTVWDGGEGPTATIDCQQFQHIHRILSRRVGVGDVFIVPASDLQRQELESCDVPSFDPSLSLDYESYTQARGCGTLRRYTLSELEAAQARGELGWQDIVVSDQAPLDIQTIIGGIVTGTRQGELSHLNVRSASRGTPNCYARDAYGLLSIFDEELIRLNYRPSEATIVRITADEALDCQRGLRPEPTAIVAPNVEATALLPLPDIATDSVEARQAAVAAYGSKGANLAALYQRIDPALQLAGFLIPMHYHDAFMRSRTWLVDLGDGIETSHSFADTVDAWLDDQAFLADGALSA